MEAARVLLRRYRIRRFRSRGGYLVLVWNFCIDVAVLLILGLSTLQMTTVIDKTLSDNGIVSMLMIGVALVIIFFLVAPLIGWLADSKYGNFAIFKVGSIGLFAVSVLNCSIIIYTSTLGDSFISYPVLFVVLTIVYFLGACSMVAVYTVLLQLGLDQLPYASSESITSFISWSFFCFLSALWFGPSSSLILRNCIVPQEYGTQILALLSVIIMSIVLSSDFIFSDQSLIKENVSPQSLKTIYCVLKFAATHKTPINRSALTYWEENIPSRIDLAKQRYGGPYTTEQVEDVKTFLKLLVVFLPLLFIMPALITYGTGVDEITTPPYLIKFKDSVCLTNLVYTVTSNSIWWVLIGNIIYEFILYPFIQNRLPSLLKRIGITSLLAVLFNIAHLCWTVAKLYIDIDQESRDWFSSASNIIVCFLLQALVSTVYEFVCAQSPYGKRGILIGYTTATVIFSVVASSGLKMVFNHFCDEQHWAKCSVIFNGITLALAIIGTVLHCFIAHKYKMRVREDIDNVCVLVEEVYDRYLDQENSHSRKVRIY